MAFPPGSPGSQRIPPLEGAASAALAAVRQRMGSRQFPQPEPRRLTDQERAEAMAAIASGQGCPCCGGIHVQEDFGCPRLAWFRRDADGRLVEGVYWADGQYDARRITFADPAEEAGDGGN